MPNNWKTYKLSEVGEIIGGGTPSTTKQEYYNGNISWITPRDLSNHNSMFISKGERSITELGLKNSSAKLMPKGSVLLTSRAPIGYLAISENEVCTNQGFKSIAVNDKIADNKFIYYLLKTNIDLLLQNATGSTFQEVSGNIIKNLEFNFPTLQEQQSIACILSAIDDKIENNLAINKTLEKMAMALYKHWFVDFGPFKDGKFVESELGLIPTGWEVKKITTLIDVKDGTHDSPKRVEDGHFLITSKHMTGNSIDFSSAYKVSFEDFSKINKRSLVEKGDILMTMIGTVGNFYFVNEEPNYVIKNIGLFKTSKAPELQSYFYSYFKSKIGQEFIKAQMTGSTQQYVTLNTLRNFDIIIPNKQTLTRFNQITNDYFETIMINTKENQTLTQLRDTLLPKLISGEVRLKEFREN